MYEYRCTITKVVDADTFHVAIDLGLDVTINETVRLSGVNAPEMGTDAGKAAKVWVESELANRGTKGWTIKTTKDKREKYGRYLGALSRNEWCLNSELVAAGHAITYMP